MALKRKSRVTDTYSMASMTDVIFLLLIFFLVTSTIIVPNTIKVTLPTSAPQSSPEQPLMGTTIWGSSGQSPSSSLGRSSGSS